MVVTPPDPKKCPGRRPRSSVRKGAKRSRVIQLASDGIRERGAAEEPVTDQGGDHRGVVVEVCGEPIAGGTRRPQCPTIAERRLPLWLSGAELLAAMNPAVQGRGEADRQPLAEVYALIPQRVDASLTDGVKPIWRSPASSIRQGECTSPPCDTWPAPPPRGSSSARSPARRSTGTVGSLALKKGRVTVPVPRAPLLWAVRPAEQEADSGPRPTGRAP